MHRPTTAAMLLCGATAPLPKIALATAPIMLRPARVLDGMDGKVQTGWQVLVRGNRIMAVGPNLPISTGARVIDLAGDTLVSGMIEGHGHFFLYPYNEANWDDQVLHEPLALRTARAVTGARAILARRAPAMQISAWGRRLIRGRA